MSDVETEAAAKVLAEWLGLAWVGLHDFDISAEWPDWTWSGNNQKHMQGGRPALRRVARAMLDASGRGAAQAQDDPRAGLPCDVEPEVWR